MALFSGKKRDEATGVDGVLTPTRLVPLLAALFCIAFTSIFLLRIETERNEALERARSNGAREAQLLAARIDAGLQTARSSIDAATLLLNASSNANAEIATLLADRAPGLTTVVLADQSGTVLASIGQNNRQLIAGVLDQVKLSKSPEEPLGKAGWEAVIYGYPVIARRLDNGTVLFSALDPKSLLPTPSDGRRLIVTDPDANIIALVPAFANPTEAPAYAAFGQAAPMQDTRPGGLFGVDPDGVNSIVGYARSQSGLWAYTARSSETFTKAWRGVLMFYLTTIGGVILATIAFCAVIIAQTSRFTNAREALREAEQRFRIAIEGGQSGIWEWRLNEDIVLLGDETARFLQLTNETTCTGNTFLSRLAPEDAPLLRGALSRAARNERLDITVRVGNATAPRWLQLRGRGTTMPGDRSSVRVIGVCLDVTEQRLNEEKVSNAERVLRDAIGSLSGPFALFDRNGRLVLWNGAYADTFKLDAQILQSGRRYSDVARALSRSITSSKIDDADRQLREIELMDGSWLNLVERRTTEGGLVSIGVDITAIKRQEERLVSSERQLRALVTELGRAEQAAAELADKYAIEKARAEEASVAKSGFLANMSHELRTPLNAINGFSEVMERQIFGPLGHPKYVEYVRDIHASGSHLLEMINDVLDMAKVEAGRFTIHPRPIDPTEAIEQATRLVHGRAEEKDLNLRLEGDELPDIVADQRALKQMMINLLSNAIKFTPRGGAIVIRTRKLNEQVSIAVSDTGIGIPAEHLPRLARPFEQVENEHAKQHAGSGLGLALTKSLAAMHGGRMTIDSEVGVGTTVTVFLPLVAKEQDDEQSDFARVA